MCKEIVCLNPAVPNIQSLFDADPVSPEAETAPFLLNSPADRWKVFAAKCFVLLFYIGNHLMVALSSILMP